MMSEARATVTELFDAAICNNWIRVRRDARKLRSMCSPEKRRAEVERWVRLHGAQHPKVASWIKEQQRECDAIRRLDEEPAYTRRRDWCGYAFQMWQQQRAMRWWWTWV